MEFSVNYELSTVNGQVTVEQQQFSDTAGGRCSFGELRGDRTSGVRFQMVMGGPDWAPPA